RRRHTRFSRDWSSDVCSSDLWLSFARDGAPVAPGQPAWAPYGQERNYMGFDQRPQPGQRLMPGMYEVREIEVCRRRATGGTAWKIGRASCRERDKNRVGAASL